MFDPFTLLAAHAAAVVDENPEGDGDIFALEYLHLLFYVILENLKSIARKVGDEFASMVEDAHVQHDQAGV